MKKINLLFSFLLLLSISTLAQNIIQVPAGTDGIAAAYNTAVSGDIIELTSDGGLYIETSMLVVSTKDITIRAAAGLSQKPIWACTAVSAYGGIIEASANTTVDGVILDGTAATPATVNGIITAAASGLYNIKLFNSTFRNFVKVIYGSSSAQVDSVIITNCIFQDISEQAIIFYTNTTVPGAVKNLAISNSTFWNITLEPLYVEASDADFAGTPDPVVTLDNITFYNSKRVLTHYCNYTTIRNCIFANPATGQNSYYIYGLQSSCLNSLYWNASPNLHTATSANLINADPLFNNAAAGDFSFSETSPAYNAGTDGKSLGDPRWWPVSEFINVAAGDNVISQALASAVDGQTIVLTTDGGIYNESSTLIVDKNVKLRAADGLVQKPVIASGSTQAVIEFSADFLLKGVILDGSQGAALTAVGITNKANTTGYDLTVLETDFLNFADATPTKGFGIFGVPSSVVDSVFIQDCSFAHIYDMGISFNDPLTATGSVNSFVVDNCTFWDINDEAIYVDAFDAVMATKDPSFYVNKVTVYNCGSYNIIAHYIDYSVLKNSIVAYPVLETSFAPTKIYGTNSIVENFLYFNTRDIDMSYGATDFQLLNVVIQQDPLFVDPQNGNFLYPANSPAVLPGEGGSQILLGDDKWWGLVIPVELTSFSASIDNNSVKLNWQTSTETNNKGFDIEKKFNNGKFQTIGFVAGNGTSTLAHSYSFTDKNNESGIYTYRLKQLDFDGTYEYSNEVEVDWNIINEFVLDQNYPNPFNPSTTIGYGVKEKSNVKITVINSIGEEIAVLVNEIKDSGSYKVNFDAKNIAAGVYFYKIQTNTFTQTKKMILMK